MSQAQPSPQPESSANPAPFSPTPRPVTWARCGCMAAIALFTLLVIAIIGLRMFVISQFGAERVARMREYDTQVLAIPEEWQKPVPTPSPEVVDFQFKFYDEMERLGTEFSSLLYSETTESVYWRLRHNEPVTADEQQHVNQLVEALSPIITETSSSIELPQYTAEMILYSSGTQFLPVQQFAKLSSIVAIDTARRGDCQTAMDIAALPIRYYHHEKPATLSVDVMRIASTQIALGTFHAVSVRCNDRAALQYGLDLLQQLQEMVQPLTLEEVRLTDNMSMLNRAKAFGYPASLGPQTWSEITQQVHDIYKEPYTEWAVQNFPADDRRYQYAKDILDSIAERENSDTAGPSLPGLQFLACAGLNLFGVSPGAVLADIAIPNYDEVLYRSKVMLANYDLTRVHLAQRLGELQGPAEGSVAIDAVSRYLEQVPQDPFSSSTLRFQRDKMRFYSVGPDLEDDGAAILYDATNGTVSDGDIFIP